MKRRPWFQWGRGSPGEWIIGLIEEQEAGLPTSGPCRKHGLRPATFCKPKARHGGMDLSDAKRLEQPEDENAKLKRLLADAMLETWF
jgi:putative transposase